MTITSQRSVLPDLRGQVCLLADAGTPVARRLHRLLVSAGAEIIALHHDRRPVRDAAPSSVGDDTLRALVDLTDPRAVATAMTWALKRTQAIDLAIVTGCQEAATRIALAALAARQLGFTGHFLPDRSPALFYLAPPRERAIPHLRDALGASVVFSDPIDVVVVDAWPDTPRSTVAAVEQLLSTPRPMHVGPDNLTMISHFDPLENRQLTT